MKTSTDNEILSAEQIVAALQIETRLKHIFMHITSHDIRSPINSIVNITKLLTENELKENLVLSSPLPKAQSQKSLPLTQTLSQTSAEPSHIASNKASDPTSNKDLRKGLELIHTSGKQILEIFNTLLEFITTTHFYEDLKLTAFDLEHAAHKITTTTRQFIKNSPLNLSISKNYLDKNNKKPVLITDERLLTQTLTYTMIYICSLLKAGDLQFNVLEQENDIAFEIIGKNKPLSEVPHIRRHSHAAIESYSYIDDISKPSHAPNFSLLTQNIAKMRGHVRLISETEPLELTITIPKILTFPEKT